MKATYSGRVASFDDVAGRGEIEARGGLHFPFHCTALADGSRTIAVDAAVQFRLAPGPLGALEAIAITSSR